MYSDSRYGTRMCHYIFPSSCLLQLSPWLWISLFLFLIYNSILFILTHLYLFVFIHFNSILFILTIYDCLFLFIVILIFQSNKSITIQPTITYFSLFISLLINEKAVQLYHLYILWYKVFNFIMSLPNWNRYTFDAK